MRFSLEGRSVVVTGASSGIGRACAIACSEMGATVALLGRDQVRLTETRANLAEPGRHSTWRCDFEQEVDFDGLARVIAGRTGKISGLVNCAGISTTLPFRATTKERLERFYRVNVSSPMLLTRALVRPECFAGDGGSVIFIASVMGVVGETGKALYGLTKGALVSAVRSLAVELAVKRIRVNCVSPGVVRTPMSESAAYSESPAAWESVSALHPLGIGEVRDVANACAYLLSTEASWVTGTNLVVDGGYSAR